MPSELPKVTSAQDPLGSRIRGLAEGGSQKRQREILVEEEANVLAARRAGIEIHHLFLTGRAAPSEGIQELMADTPTAVVEDSALQELFPRTRAPRMFAITALPAASSFRDLEDRPGDLVVLEGLGGPGNIGSVIRSATAFGAAGIVVLDTSRPELYRRGVIRSTGGTMFSLPLLTATVDRLQRFCRASGTVMVVTSSHASEGFASTLHRAERLALVFGSETQGCSPAIEAVADVRCRIPMNEEVESLNVSVAAAVMLFARSQRATGLFSPAGG